MSAKSSFRNAAGFCLVALVASALWLPHFVRRANASPDVQHGLTGLYYTSDLTLDEFEVPQPAGASAATRVDAQIAFGQGKGFKDPKPNRSSEWAVQPGLAMAARPDWLTAVVWRGFVHLPKAGTYYFATASAGPSVVYVNQARVALNGEGAHYGHLLTSEFFAYDPADVQDFVQNVKGTPFARRLQDAYVVPVTVDAARDFPIEVRYNGTRAESTSGIDLFWVTPDSPKNAEGKPILKLVPSEVLYAQAPGPIPQTPVRGATSTVSADLYCSGVQQQKPITLTFRVADRAGRPVSGKRVFFSTLATDPFGFDDIVQADKPTDDNGITTAQLKSRSDARAHESAIYATDVTDLIDLGQVAHVRFPEMPQGFFASPCLAGFDPNVITVEPLPMRVGRPLTLKVKLENRQKTDVELKATFEASDWNIGANTWADIGHVDDIRLKPGESRDVSIQWTPTAEQVHQCFRVRVTGGARTASIGGPGRLTASAVLGPEVIPAMFFQADDSAGSSVQRNVGPVTIARDPCYDYNHGNYAPNDYGPFGQEEQNALVATMGTPQFWDESANALRRNALATADPDKKKAWSGMADCFQYIAAMNNDATANSKPSARALANQNRTDQDTDRRMLAKCPPGNADCTATWTGRQIADGQNAREYDNIANDPPATAYRGLAVAKTDSTPAYLEALRVSLERYQGAMANSDREWMAKHLTAAKLYQERVANSLSREADEMQKKGEALGRGADAGEGQGPALLQAAARKRGEAKIWQSLADALGSDSRVNDGNAKEAQPLGGTAASQPAHQVGQTWVQTFDLNNPHERTEDVRLFIQPMTMPPAWKLSVINAEQVDTIANTAGGGTKPGPQPQFPVHEVHAGREYVVSLPPGQHIKVASVLVPVGEVGARTTALWAIEGRIGGTPIGTMVHELNVPYVIADLKLPPVGSAEQMDESEPSAQHSAYMVPRALVMVAAVIALGIIIFLFVWLRRRRARPA